MQRHNRFTKFVPNSVYVCDDVKWNQKTSKHNKNRQENRINPFSGTDLFAFINDPSPWFMSFYCVRSWCSQSDRDNGHYCWKMCKCVITMTNVCVEFVLLFWYSTANKENWFESWKKWEKSGRFRIRRKIVKMEIFINYRKERKSKRNLMKQKLIIEIQQWMWAISNFATGSLASKCPDYDQNHREHFYFFDSLMNNKVQSSSWMDGFVHSVRSTNATFFSLVKSKKWSSFYTWSEQSESKHNTVLHSSQLQTVNAYCSPSEWKKMPTHLQQSWCSFYRLASLFFIFFFRPIQGNVKLIFTILSSFSLYCDSWFF